MRMSNICIVYTQYTINRMFKIMYLFQICLNKLKMKIYSFSIDTTVREFM